MKEVRLHFATSISANRGPKRIYSQFDPTRFRRATTPYNHLICSKTITVIVRYWWNVDCGRLVAAFNGRTFTQAAIGLIRNASGWLE